MSLPKELRFVVMFLLTISAFQSIASDTLHVIPYKGETIVTDPSKGFHLYKKWGVFPAADVAVRKIVLHVKFECPDSMRCADWDYLDFIKIKRVGGANGLDKDFEFARMLTPYGGAFNKDWKFNWDLDVTDFSMLLRDSVEIEYNHTGYEPNKDRGWKVTLDFEIIKGTPAVIPVSIQKIYSESFVYGDSAVSIEEKLQAVTFQKEPGADFAKFRIYQTGHGANDGDACGEFCSKKRMIVYNNELIDTRPIWRECGDNPLYPQAGTWIYDRANWCPGYLQIPDEYYLPLQQANSIDVNMEPYRVNKTQAAENITAYIIQYKKVVAANDVSIIDIKRPTDKLIHSRENPSVFKPAVVIKNNGFQKLTSVKIQYGTIGFKQKTYQWNGSLPYGAETEIELPGLIDAAYGENYFTVSLAKPNSKKDAYEMDNTMSSRFTAASVHSEKLVFVLKTNNQPEHNSYAITDINDKVLFQRAFDSTMKNTMFKDTVLLPLGAYHLLVKDSANDGLEFWANRRGGSGYMRIEDAKGNLVKQFNGDFGSYINYNFATTKDSARWSELNEEIAVTLYPTSTSDKTTLDYFGGKANDVTVQIITDEGAMLVEEHHYKNLKEGVFTYDMSYRPAQRYYIKVFVDGKLQFNKRLRVVEARR